MLEELSHKNTNKLGSEDLSKIDKEDYIFKRFYGADYIYTLGFNTEKAKIELLTAPICSENISVSKSNKSKIFIFYKIVLSEKNRFVSVYQPFFNGCKFIYGLKLIFTILYYILGLEIISHKNKISTLKEITIIWFNGEFTLLNWKIKDDLTSLRNKKNNILIISFWKLPCSGSQNC